MISISNDQFDALARLLRLGKGPSREAARLILVEGHSPTQAAHLVGCSTQSASNTHQRCLVGLRLVFKAAGLEVETDPTVKKNKKSYR